MQLASPALPVWAYTYSQGLEQAVDTGRIADEEGARVWIADALVFNLGRWEAPTVATLHRAWTTGDDAAVRRLDRAFVASRETEEFRAETLQMGHFLSRLLLDLDAFRQVGAFGARLAALREAAYPTVWSAAAAAWCVPLDDALAAYAWAWLENQVLAAVKLVPLGQSAGQRLLATLGERIPGGVLAAAACDEAAFENLSPGLAIASAAHETQYSRLFRS